MDADNLCMTITVIGTISASIVIILFSKHRYFKGNDLPEFDDHEIYKIDETENKN